MPSAHRVLRYLDGYSLSGTIPPEMGKLSSLTDLYVAPCAHCVAYVSLHLPTLPSCAALAPRHTRRPRLSVLAQLCTRTSSTQRLCSLSEMCTLWPGAYSIGCVVVMVGGVRYGLCGR